MKIQKNTLAEMPISLTTQLFNTGTSLITHNAVTKAMQRYCLEKRIGKYPLHLSITQWCFYLLYFKKIKSQKHKEYYGRLFSFIRWNRTKGKRKSTRCIGKYDGNVKLIFGDVSRTLKFFYDINRKITEYNESLLNRCFV